MIDLAMAFDAELHELETLQAEIRQLTSERDEARQFVAGLTGITDPNEPWYNVKLNASAISIS